MAPLRRRNVGRPPLEEHIEPDAPSGDLLDVPAAVVCVRCGNADCPGCEDALSRSGIVAIVAWERPAPLFTRLWSTARSATRDAETFFELLPDGPIMPAFKFALISEVIAVTTMFALVIPIAAIVAPEWLKHVALDPDARAIALRVVVLGLPAFAALLVLAHAAHGITIDIGARKTGARGARSRALRFGLYACGWDLVRTPLGIALVALREGLAAASELLSPTGNLPTLAPIAFLRGAYGLTGEKARAALRTSIGGAILVTIVFAIVVIAALTAITIS